MHPLYTSHLLEEDSKVEREREKEKEKEKMTDREREREKEIERKWERERESEREREIHHCHASDLLNENLQSPNPKPQTPNPHELFPASPIYSNTLPQISKTQTRTPRPWILVYGVGHGVEDL